MTSNLLSKIEAWHKVEFLTPYQLQREIEDYVFKEDEQIPWLQHEKYRLKETNISTFRFTVYLGVMDTEQVMQIVREYLDDKKQPIDDINYKTSTAIAEIQVDFQGKFVSGSFKLSTVPYALGKLKTGNIKEDWFHDFNKVNLELNNMAERELKEVVTVERLRFIQDEISTHLGWSSNYQAFVAKKKKIVKGKNKDRSTSDVEMGILNSFFIKDLELVRTSLKHDHRGVNGLHKYLSGEEIPLNLRSDIHRDKEKLAHILSPKNIPLGKWPGNPKHSLNLMQQAAVNLIFQQLSDKRGTFSVNGPPGTGKTTLLRDVIAGILVQRAEKLITFDKPRDAFSPLKDTHGSNKKIGKSYVNLLSPELCGYGIIVASSNNGAVENISKELPDMESIDPLFKDIEGADYFREIIHRTSGDSSWGLISAPLGNSKNRYSFFTNFIERNNDEDGDQIGKSYLEIHDKCKAISQKDHVDNWNKARKLFREALEDVLQLKREAIDIYEMCNKRETIKSKYIDYVNKQDIINQNLENLKEKKNILHEECIHLEEQISLLKASLKYNQEQKFGLIIILFRLKPYREHQKKANGLNQAISDHYQNLSDKKSEMKSMEKSMNMELYKYNDWNNKCKNLKREYDNIDNKIRLNSKEKLNENPHYIFTPVDFKKDKNYTSIQKSSPWMTEEFSIARSKLFLAAMHVHECFIRAATSKVIGNILLLNKINSINMFADKEVFKPIWDVFTLIVPVVSTTFASVSSMFRGVGKEELGWLLIDEAGQAVPQAAVGAIWRSKKTIAVGDPLQVEPVVTLPKSVFDDIREHYNVSEAYLSLKSSVQTVMDLSNTYGTHLKDQWMGSPLWVHRRCIDPMFTICNEIAYEGNMVLATKDPYEQDDSLVDKEKSLVQFLNHMGPSSWYQVEGDAALKQYVPAQGEVVVDLVKRAFQYSNESTPDLYIITPFTAVKEELKTLLRKRSIEITGDPGFKNSFNKWIHHSVGTVHTFQGKEASVVIFCLGVDQKNTGAAKWVAEEPNLINVAVSRAKYRLYIIGDSNVWKSPKNMEVIKRELEILNQIPL